MSSEVWLKTRDVVAITGWSERHLRRLVAEGSIRTKRDEGYTGRGVAPSLYAASSLPSEYQPAVLDFALRQATATEGTMALVPAPQVLPQTVQQTLFPPHPTTTGRLLVPPEREPEARRRLEAIQPLLDWQNGARPLVFDNDRKPIRNMDQLAAWIAPQYEVSRATLWNWVKRFREFGIGGLCADVRSDKGSSRYFDHHPAARKWIEAKYAGERLSIAVTYRSLKQAWGTALLPERGDPPSYSTVNTYLTDILPNAIAVVGREGETGYNKKIENYLRRDYRSVDVNQIWVSDHRIFDDFVWNDCLPGVAPGAAFRLWVTVLIDMRSRRIVGWAFAGNPSSVSISSALHMAIGQFGTPEVFYCDNGKDYKKVGRVELTPEASGVLHRLEVKVQYCIPKHPQSKLVESFFSGMSRRFDVLFGDSYAGSKPSLRPEQCEDLRKQHNLWLRGKASRTELMPVSEFMQCAEQWIAEYNDTPHSGQAMNGETPIRVFERDCPPDSRNIPDIEKLAPLFWDRQKRKVLRGGCVEIYGERYEPFTPESKAAMYERIDRDVLIACDPNDLAQAIVMDLDGQLLAYVSVQRLIAHGPISQEDIKASLRERRAIRRALQNYVAAQMRGVPTETQLMRKRAGLPMLVESAPNAPLSSASLRLAAGAESGAPTYAEDAAEEFLKLCGEEN